jgi:hypothetical protein
MAMVHLVDPCHFVHASSTVSGHLAEAFAKNSKPKGFEDIVPTSLHTYADVFSEMAFDSLQSTTVMFHKCLTPKSVTIRSYKQQK